MILNDEIRKKKNPAVINIYNFIRKTVYPSGEFIQDDFETVLYQIETINQYGLPATYALKYDALMDSRYSNLIKENKIEEKLRNNSTPIITRINGGKVIIDGRCLINDDIEVITEAFKRIEESVWKH